MSGPCTPWTTVGEVKATGRAKMENGTDLPDGLIDAMITLASGILYRLSGRQFAGLCHDTVFPTARWYRIPAIPTGAVTVPNRMVIDRFSTRNPRFDPLLQAQEITLGSYPIRRIVEVRVGGTVRDASTYQLVDRRYLQNLGPDWPAFPDLLHDPLDVAWPSTFRVQTEYGQTPPPEGVTVCNEYVIQLAKGASGDPCNLPARVTSIQAPGMTYALLDPMLFIENGKTGVYVVDMWLRSVNPSRLARRSAVLRPGAARPVRRVQNLPDS